jgi:phenylalanyl-tRNA synthetase beta chain
MRVPTQWLADYIDLSAPLDELAEKLTMAGLEVEEVLELSRDDFAAAGGSGTRDETVWNVKVTPNRGDWLSMIGVARELGPLVGQKKRMPSVDVPVTDSHASEFIDIRIDDPDLCRRYVGAVIKGVRVAESPDWMKDRLIAAGMRPINNVVDVTNYVMLELGQPLHAFDLSLLRGSHITVRRARLGETITSIDCVERKLDPDMLVIADADRPVAIAGVMGGAESEISEQTQDILVESANFNSVSIRRTSKRLNLVTESSYRFEREVDPSICAVAALRAVQLIRELGGGEVARGIVDVYPTPVEPMRLSARPERVNAVLGTDIGPADMVRFLNSLEIDAELSDGLIACRVPTFRSDVTREIDIVEEVGRVYGYDNMPMTLPRSSMQGRDSREGAFRDRLRRILMSCGAQEVLTHSLVDGSLAELAGKFGTRVAVRNPLSEDLDSMRVSLVPNLLQVLSRNQAFGNTDLSVFEIGKVYYKSADGEIGEKLAVAGAMVGGQWRSAWSLPANALDADFFLCKGMVESLLDGLGVVGAVFDEVSDAILHPTRAAKIVVAGQTIGVLGEIAPSAADALDVRGRPCAFEIDFESLFQVSPDVLTYREVARYPALYRHLAVVVSDSVKYRDVERAVLASGQDLIEQVSLLDVYKGEPIAPDQRSLTLSMVFRAPERTLTDDEVNQVLEQVREALRRHTGASFR